MKRGGEKAGKRDFFEILGLSGFSLCEIEGGSRKGKKDGKPLCGGQKKSLFGGDFEGKIRHFVLKTSKKIALRRKNTTFLERGVVFRKIGVGKPPILNMKKTNNLQRFGI